MSDQPHMSAKDYRTLVCGDMPMFMNPVKKKSKKVEHSPKEVVRIKKKFDGLKVKWNPASQPWWDDNQLEYDLTCQVAQYLDVLVMQKKVVCYSHIPQETFTRSRLTKHKNSAMGVHAGVPDMLIVYPHAVLFLELKRLKGGKVSEAQKRWVEAINTIWDEHVYAKVVCGWCEAKEEIDSYFIK